MVIGCPSKSGSLYLVIVRFGKFLSLLFSYHPHIARPEPLTHKPVLMTAADYFAVLEVQKPSTPFPKHDGEPGHKPGKSHKGYVLADVLAWPMEVYKEVQVNRFLSLLLVLMIWIVDHP